MAEGLRFGFGSRKEKTKFTDDISNILNCGSSTSSSMGNNQSKLRTPRSSRSSKSRKKSLPGIIVLIEQGNWTRVAERAKKYPKECRVWSTIKKSSKGHGHSPSNSETSLDASPRSFRSEGSTISPRTTLFEMSGSNFVNAVKCKALHHACHRLRSVHSHIQKMISQAIGPHKLHHGQSFESIDSYDNCGYDDGGVEMWDDPWIEACKAILAIIEVHPEAAAERETRHGCLPLHLAAFAMCPTPSIPASMMIDDFAPPSTRSRSPRFSPTFSEHKMNFNESDFAFDSQRIRSLSRRNSASSAASMTSSYGAPSLDGFTAVLEAPSAAHGKMQMVEDAFVLSEKRLRQNEKRGMGNDSEDTVLESVRMLLSKDLRPHPISSGGPRNVSAGSMNSTNSNSYSINSTNTAITLPMTGAFHTRRFSVRGYIANTARRQEYSIRVVNALMNAYSKGVRMDSEGGRLPLHTAVAGKASPAIIETICRAYPDAAKQRNKEGSLPLHLAAYFGVSHPEIAPLLLRAYPDSSVGRNRWERTPLEESLVMGGENGRKYQIQLVEALRRPPAFWEAQSFRGRTQHFNTDIDDLLMGEGRNTNSLPDGDHMTVHDDLVVLIKARCWDIVVDKLKKKTPIEAINQIQTTVRAGYLAQLSAIHLSCEQNPTYEVVDALLSLCPDSIRWPKNPGNQLPLHDACTWGASSDVIGFLLAAYPKSSKKQDNLGNLPLHCACFSGASLKVIESLLCTFPGAILCQNLQGSNPRDIVQRLKHSNRKAIMNLIEQVSLELLKKKRKESDVLKEMNPTEGNCNNLKHHRINISRSESLSGSIEVELADPEEEMLWI